MVKKHVIRAEVIEKICYQGFCDNCGAELSPVHSVGISQWDNAVEFSIHGYCGGYFDDCTINVLLCQECVDKILLTFTHLKKSIMEQCK